MDRIDARATSPQLTEEAAARLDSLFREYNPFVVRYAMSLLGDLDLAEDIAQNVWLSVAPKVMSLNGATSLRPFLSLLVKRRIADYRRPLRNNERPADWTDVITSRSLPVTASPEADVIALASLTPQQCTVMKLAAQGLSQSAIASRIGRRQSTVWKSLHAGARRLRSDLSKAR